MTDEQAVVAMLAEIGGGSVGLDVLVLNASGGLEPGADAGYPMRLNRDAQVRLARLALPLMTAGGRIVFVTSHLAHFHGRKPVPTDYVPDRHQQAGGRESVARHAAKSSRRQASRSSWCPGT